MIFRQLFDHDTSTYTYILADENSLDAVIIDPVFEQFERDLKILNELNLKLKYILETHVHADHKTGAFSLKLATQAIIAIGRLSHTKNHDLLLDESNKISFGKYSLSVISTPGHTDSCTSFYGHGLVFTGDTLFIRGCGRTDFQEGSTQKLFHSVREKLFQLPGQILVYPAHDYKGISNSSIEEEKKYNPRLNLSKDFNDFDLIMKNLNLTPPKKIKESLPWNLLCGKD